MKSALTNLLQQARAALPSKAAPLASQLLQVEAQLDGKVVVDKAHLRTLLLAVVDNGAAIQELRNMRWLHKNSTINVLLDQLNEEG